MPLCSSRRNSGQAGMKGVTGIPVKKLCEPNILLNSGSILKKLPRPVSCRRFIVAWIFWGRLAGPSIAEFLRLLLTFGILEKQLRIFHPRHQSYNTPNNLNQRLGTSKLEWIGSRSVEL